MTFKRADRLDKLPPYLFRELARMKAKAVAEGADIIDLGIGDPDRPTAGDIIAAGQKAMADPGNHRYPSDTGMLSFRQAAVDWFEKRFGPKLNPEDQVMALIGSKEGVAHFPLAFINPGDLTLCPSPAYPVPFNSTILAGGEPYEMPLTAENEFWPVFEDIPESIANRAKILYLNYPGNPTSAEGGLDKFAEAVAFAEKYDLIIAHDAAYTEMTFDGYVAPSFLQTPGALERTIEFHSLSKPHRMTGWRMAMAFGCPELLSGLATIKSNVDSGVFEAIQEAGIAALAKPVEEVRADQEVYARRRKAILPALEKLGIEVWPTRATFYIWAKVPGAMSSTDFSARCLKEAAVVVTPGNGLGSHGEGWFRIALSQPEARLHEAAQRLAEMAL